MTGGVDSRFVKLPTLAVAVLVVLASLGCSRERTAAQRAPSEPSYFKEKMACATAGERRRASALREAPDMVLAISEQCYVPTMHTCVYEVAFITQTRTWRFVEDLATGHKFAEYTSTGVPDIDTPAFAEFQQVRARMKRACADAGNLP